MTKIANLKRGKEKGLIGVLIGGLIIGLLGKKLEGKE
jgi:hypothetical protein